MPDRLSFDSGRPREDGDPRESLLVLADARRLLHIGEGRDHDLDDQIADYVLAANTRIATELEPYADASPPLPGTRTFEAARDACRYYFLSMWYRDHFQPELAKSQRDEFEAACKSLKRAITADKPPRRESTLIVRSRALDDRIYEPAAADQYLTREFF